MRPAELVPSDPPPDRTRKGGGRREDDVDWDAVVREMRAIPGAWRRVVICPHRAHSGRCSLRAAIARADENPYLWETPVRHDSETGELGLWVRFGGDGIHAVVVEL